MEVLWKRPRWLEKVGNLDRAGRPFSVQRGTILATDMARHKTLRSVARSVADQFTSFMNYSGDDYVMGHLVSAARAARVPHLQVDWLTGKAEPPELLIPPVAKSIRFYTSAFADLVARSQSHISLVREAILTIDFDLAKTRPRFVGDPYLETPYVCRMSIIDDRGRQYVAELTGRWYPERLPYASRWDRVKRFFRRALRHSS